MIPYQILGLTHALSWVTDVIATANGKEQRIARRRAPRETFDVALAVDAELDRRGLRYALFHDPVSTWDLPLPHEACAVLAAVTGASATVDATYDDRFAVGSKVYVQSNDPAVGFEATISGASGPANARVLALSAGPSSGTYSAGLARVLPVLEVYMDDQQATAREAAAGDAVDADLEDVGAGSWSLKAVAKKSPATLGAGASLTSFDSKYVLDVWPEIEGEAGETFDAALTRFDSQGIAAQIWTRPHANVARQHLYEGRSVADRQFWKLFFAQHYGRQVAFLAPTWQPDLDLVSQPAGGTTIDVVQNPGFLSWFATAPHKWLALLKVDGTIQYAKATAVSTVSGHDRVTVSTTVTGPDVERVSLLELVRFGEDDVAFTWAPDATTFSISPHLVVVQQ
jgi:hypothetical protein